jgi:purine-binding chemotaxis protein CheW
MNTTAVLATPQPGTSAAAPLARLAGKYLTFVLDREEYGLPVLRIREIIKVMEITAVPQVPGHVRGVINLRGKVIPVVDLRVKFGFDVKADDDRTCIVVVDAAADGGRVMMGMVVDAVSEVLTIGGDQIEAPPHFGRHVRTDFIQGLAKVKGKVKILLDLDRVLGAEAGALAAQPLE